MRKARSEWTRGDALDWMEAVSGGQPELRYRNEDDDLPAAETDFATIEAMVKSPRFRVSILPWS